MYVSDMPQGVVCSDEVSRGGQRKEAPTRKKSDEEGRAMNTPTRRGPDEESSAKKPR